MFKKFILLSVVVSIFYVPTDTRGAENSQISKYTTPFVASAIVAVLGAVVVKTIWDEKIADFHFVTKKKVIEEYYIQSWGKEYLDRHPEKYKTKWVYQDSDTGEFICPELTHACRAMLETGKDDIDLSRETVDWVENSAESSRLWGSKYYWCLPGTLEESKVSYWKNHDFKYLRLKSPWELSRLFRDGQMEEQSTSLSKSVFTHW